MSLKIHGNCPGVFFVKFNPLSANSTKWSNTPDNSLADELFECVSLFYGVAA